MPLFKRSDPAADALISSLEQSYTQYIGLSPHEARKTASATVKACQEMVRREVDPGPDYGTRLLAEEHRGDPAAVQLLEALRPRRMR
jgi:hypothetical protein